MKTTGRFQLDSPTSTLLDEIATPTLYQRDVAQSYALALALPKADVDWRKVNAAIIKRWSLSGLARIKELAWSGRCWGRQ